MKVFITVNPDLIAGKRMQTVRSMVTELDKVCDLAVLPIDEIDFRTGSFRAYTRIPQGKFRIRRDSGKPPDLWINYTDGYYLEHEELGYRRPSDFIEAQFRFYESLKQTRVINAARAERRTLKAWFEKLDPNLKVIPTFVPKDHVHLRALLKEHGPLVLKPNWGGASTGVCKLESVEDVDALPSVKDQVVQLYRKGPEKRLWFCGSECVGGRIVHGRKTPWSDFEPDSVGEDYSSGRDFQRDAALAKNVWELSELEIGSVDFIGDEINELNGCGTTFVYYVGWKKIVDAREALVDYVVSVVRDFNN